MSENVEAVEVPWAAVTREIKSAKVDGQFNIDVVSAGSLSTYLADRVNKFGNAVAEIASNDPQPGVPQLVGISGVFGGS